MKIGFFINPTNLKAGGIFTYSIGILKLLLEAPEIENIYLIYSSGQREYLKEYFNNKKIIPIKINRENILNDILLKIYYFLYDISIIYSGYLTSTSRLDFLKRVAIFFNPYKKIKKLPIDILHIPAQYSPIYKINIPVVVTMHDVQELHFPEFFSSSERLHRAINSKKSLEDSDHIIVSFDHIMKDLVKYFKINEEKISICPPPFHTKWFSKDEFSSFDVLKNKYGIEKEFLLYPAATWPHKNHKVLLEAIKNLKGHGIRVQLICTGFKTEYYKYLQNIIKEYQLSDVVKFLGIIPEEDLIGLYKTTALVVIPTLYEAGSGPMYEAMKYGAPVITSNVTSLPETMGDERFLFDPNDVKTISDLISKMLNDNSIRQINILNSRERMEILSKRNYINNFLEAYKKIIQDKNNFNLLREYYSFFPAAQKNNNYKSKY